MIKETSAAFAAAMGRRIKVRREHLGLSQEELATRLGYKGKGSISRIESGETEIATTKLSKMADALDTSVAYLMGWVDPGTGAENSLSTDELELIGYYREMNDTGKISALLSVKGLSEQELFKKEAGIAADG